MLLKSKELFVVLLMFVICSCKNDSLPDSLIMDKTDGESISFKVKQNINNIEFKYDFSNDQLYSVIDKYTVIYDINNILIEGDTLIIPFIIYDSWNKKIITDICQYLLQEDKAGVLLSFDDYFSCWDDYLYLFDEFSIKSTFFVKGTLSQVKNFSTKAQNQGHEIGFHTIAHKALTLLTEDEIKQTCIDPVLLFHKNYIYIYSFAFPNGLWAPSHIEMLLPHYKILRLFDNVFRLYSIRDIADQRVIFSQSIDKNKFSDDNDFRNQINKRLLITKLCKKIYPMTTHYILSYPGEISTDAFTISKENLIYLFETINKYKLISYRYNDMYPYFY